MTSPKMIAVWVAVVWVGSTLPVEAGPARSLPVLPEELCAVAPAAGGIRIELPASSNLGVAVSAVERCRPGQPPPVLAVAPGVSFGRVQTVLGFLKEKGIDQVVLLANDGRCAVPVKTAGKGPLPVLLDVGGGSLLVMVNELAFSPDKALSCPEGGPCSGLAELAASLGELAKYFGSDAQLFVEGDPLGGAPASWQRVVSVAAATRLALDSPSTQFVVLGTAPEEIRRNTATAQRLLADGYPSGSEREFAGFKREVIVGGPSMKVRGAIFRAIIGQRHDALVACYRAGLKDNPALGGKVLVQWQTRYDPGEPAGYGKGAPDGIARDAHGARLVPISGLKVVESALKHPGVEACLLEALRPLKFPSYNLGLTTVSWPFVLVPETGEVQSALPDSSR